MQFFIWGSWLVTLASYLFQTLHFKGSEIGLIFSALGIASLLSPVITGMVADKINNTRLVFVSLHVFSGLALIVMSHATTVYSLFWATLLHLIFYMPSISMCNSIIFELLEKKCLDAKTFFPKVRVMGTVGFIIAMWVISIFRLEASHVQLYISSAASFVLAGFSLFIPFSARGSNDIETKADFRFRDAVRVFSKRKIVVFLFFAMLLGSVLQITNTLGVPFLQDLAKAPEAEKSLFASYPTIFLSISQLSEVCFILLLPLLLKRVKIEKILLLSMIAWILRFGLFAYGDFTGMGVVLLLLSMIVYGCAFDFFNISGSLFLEQEIPLEYRSTAQGVFMTLVNGFGTYLGAMLSGWVLDLNTINNVIDWHMFWIFFASYTTAFTAMYLIYMLVTRKTIVRTNAEYQTKKTQFNR